MRFDISLETIIIAISLTSLSLVWLKKSGYITIGRAHDRRDCAKKCAEHEVVFSSMKANLASYDKSFNEIRDDILDIKSDIKDIRKMVRDMEIGNSKELSNIRELIGNLKGLIDGLHSKGML